MTVSQPAENAAELGLRLFEQMLRPRALEDGVQRRFAQGLAARCVDY